MCASVIWPSVNFELLNWRLLRNSREMWTSTLCLLITIFGVGEGFWSSGRRPQAKQDKNSRCSVRLSFVASLDGAFCEYTRLVTCITKLAEFDELPETHHDASEPIRTLSERDDHKALSSPALMKASWTRRCTMFVCSDRSFAPTLRFVRNKLLSCQRAHNNVYSIKPFSISPISFSWMNSHLRTHARRT